MREGAEGGLADGHLGVDGEGHAVGGRAELLDLIKAPRLLGTEVVAGERDHAEPLAAIALLQGLQTSVLAGETATAGDVDGQQDLTIEVAEALLLATAVGHHNIVDADGHEIDPGEAGP